MKDKPDQSKQRRVSKIDDRYGKTRRRVLQSLAMGGTAITVKKFPEKWAKPVLDTTILPAHAQATCTVESLTCVLGNVTGLSTDADLSSPTPFNGSPAPGSYLTILEAREMGSSADISFTGLSATLDPECPQPITLLASENFAGADFDLDSGNLMQTVVPVNGIASFSNITALADSSYGGTATFAATVEFTFRTASLPDCVINVVFQEDVD